MHNYYGDIFSLGNLKLDTGTLGFSDIQGHDRETSYYVNVGGSFGWDGIGNDSAIVTDPSQQGRGERDSAGWSLIGNYYEKDREQIVRATVGEGQIIVRNDAQNGMDSTTGLNRDPSKAYEITRDDKEGTDLYLSGSSLALVQNPLQAVAKWEADLKDYGRNASRSFTNYGKLTEKAEEAAAENNMLKLLVLAPKLVEEGLDLQGYFSTDLLPGSENRGGLITQIPQLLTGEKVTIQVDELIFLKDASGNLIMDKNGKPIPDLENTKYEIVEQIEQDGTLFINGQSNTLSDAMLKAYEQTSGETAFTLGYNPTHGFWGDTLESGWQKLFIAIPGVTGLGNQRDLHYLLADAIARGVQVDIYAHSQGTQESELGIRGLNFETDQRTPSSIQFSGSPINAIKFHEEATSAGFNDDKNRIFQVNRSDEKYLGIFPKTDSVSDFLGGNANHSENPTLQWIGSIISFRSLFESSSLHSTYGCQTGKCKEQGNNNSFINDYVPPTLIDKDGNYFKVGNNEN